jgi:two-component system, chemotaxis family, protein-glutamate methylesterase/glutaminase
MNHDVDVIGASAGGVEILLDMAGKLPLDLAASLFVVVHLSPDHPSTLPELLSNRGPLRAIHPLHDEAIRPGMIYVAPPDNHLQLRPGTIEVVRGPRVNGHRPAVDVLFRTAAAAYGSRVIAVVLSGYQDCGTAGMMSVKSRGGISVVQDPATAAAPDMPRHVIDRVKVDHIVTPGDLASVLTRLVAAPPGPTGQPTSFVQQIEGTELGQRAEVVCPICEGVLTEAQPGVFQHFRCHVGHAFTLESLVREQSEELERVLWAAVRALEESAALAQRVSGHETGDLRARFAEKAQTHAQQAHYIRMLLLHGKSLRAKDSSALG